MKLAVTLAERFNGEIINGDALQLYKGLPVATNKLSVEKRKGIPHYLLDCIDLEDEPWDVSKFVTEGERVIDEIRARGKLPILVGGTNYYTQSTLFQDSTLEDKDEHLSIQEQEERWPILGANEEAILKELYMIDPEMARRWHPRDHRKIRRSLEIWLQTGKRASELYKAQRSGDTCLKDQGNAEYYAALGDVDKLKALQISDGELSIRFDVLLLWVHADSDTLKSRLNSRVDEMIRHGLLDEIKYMRTVYRNKISNPRNIDMTRGIWIAIGYKEFTEYFKAHEEGIESEKLKALLEDGIERVKAATRQYAKRQVRWIRLKLRRALQDSGDLEKLFLLDGSDLSEFSSRVEDMACDLTESFLEGRPLPNPTTLSRTATEMLTQDPEKAFQGVHARFCETCGITLMTEKEWTGHVRSKRHKGILKRAKPRETEKGKLETIYN